jgi:lipoprotein signal peptidase
VKIRQVSVPFILFLALSVIIALLPFTRTWAVGLALLLGAAVSNTFPSSAPPSWEDQEDHP